MINNKQVNLWRGDQEPPTLYHIWLKDNKQLLLYTGTEWKVFLDSSDTLEQIEEIFNLLVSLQNQINTINNNTINNKKISSNPVLDSQDIKIKTSGNFVQTNKTVDETIILIDQLLTTQIIE